MAGGWSHIVDDEGRFIGDKHLENGGDVKECLEELYGMVWYLASALATQNTRSAPEHDEDMPKYVELARQNYQKGLEISPSTTYRRRT